jgi:hypothetical protein
MGRRGHDPFAWWLLGPRLGRLALVTALQLDASVEVGARGAGPSKVLVGSTATTLAAHAKVPVLVAGGTGSPAGSR